MANETHGDRPQSTFWQGFFLGAIVGGIVIFLLGTKKGKKILKLITDEGMEGVTEIKGLLQEVSDEYESYEEEGVEKEPVKRQKPKNGEAKQEEKILAHVAKPARRFFRGIKRKN